MKSAFFCRKASDIQELIEITKDLIQSKEISQEYTVTKEIYLNNHDFELFANDLSEDQDWISEEDGGVFYDTVHCIRVVNQSTNEALLVNSEGYTYPRYTAIELR